MTHVRDILASTHDAYAVLKVPREASHEEIKRSHRRLALVCHPDKNSTPEAAEAFRHVQRAYETLSDPQLRMLYDRGGFQLVEQHLTSDSFPGFRVVLVMTALWAARAKMRGATAGRRRGHFASSLLALLALSVVVVACLYYAVTVTGAAHVRNSSCTLARCSGTSDAILRVHVDEAVICVTGNGCVEENQTVVGALLRQYLFTTCKWEQQVVEGAQLRCNQTVSAPEQSPNASLLATQTFKKKLRPWRSKFVPNSFSIEDVSDIPRLSPFCVWLSGRTSARSGV